MVRPRASIVALLLLIGCRGNHSEALTAAGAFFSALDAGDWATAAELVSDSAAHSFYEQHVRPRLAVPDTMPPISLEDILRANPDMPREVAAYEAAQMDRFPSSPANDLFSVFAGVPNRAALSGLTPREALARYLAGWHAMPPMDVYDHTGSVGSVAQPAPLVASWRYEVLGVVPEGSNVAHVTYRVEQGLRNVVVEPRTRVATLRRTLEGWRVATFDAFDGVESGTRGLFDLMIPTPAPPDSQ